jgi:mono/diheme cytochrome c family protein
LSLLKTFCSTAFQVLAALAVLPAGLHAQYMNFDFYPNAQHGKRVFREACVSCHGSNGSGAPQTLTVFTRPSTFPDFTRCDQTTSETNTAYKDVITHGGPARGFSQIMPAFGEALSSKEIDDVIAYLRELCPNAHWPRGELNVPRALVTEKAYPEDEVVLSTGINSTGTPGNESHIIHEQRFGRSNQIEVDVPIIFQDQGHTWYGGVGDVTLGLKRVLFSSLRSGSILSLQGGFLLPTGNHQRGFGAGTTTFESFAAFDQIFRSNTTVQLQFGADLPFDTSKSPQSWFFNSAIGQSFAGDHGLGRLWTPMFEFLANRDLVNGAKTDWDVMPEMQVTISKRQHVRGSLGYRIPVSSTAGRQQQIMFYLLWDWADGGLLSGW